VLEQWDVAGGSSHVFRRRNRFEFDVGLHYIGDCEPGGVIPTILRGAGLEGRVEFLEMDPDGFDTLLFPGFQFRVPRGWDRYLDRLVATFPGDEGGLRRCVSVMRSVAEQIEDVGLPTTEERLHVLLERGPAVLEWGMRPLSDLFDACQLGAGARAVLAGQSGDHAAPPSRVAIVMHASLIHHYLKAGAYYPRGGGQVLAAHLIDVIRAHGGRVRTRARVEQILVEGGAARGVRLRGGEIVTAPVVISGADIKHTLLELVGRDRLAQETVQRTEGYRMALPLFTAYLGLDIDLCEHMPNTNYFAHPTLDVESSYSSVYEGGMPDQPSVFLSSASVKDPYTSHIAPPGHSTIEVMTIVPPDYAFWNVERGPYDGARYSKLNDYRAVKERLVDEMIERATEVIPAIEGHIVWREASTPLTQERYTLASGGSCYGIELATDQSGPMRPRPQTEIAGLFLTGASTMTGHGIVGVMRGGVSTAGAVLGRDLLAEIEAGAVLGDSSLLTAGGAGWDPLKASRGLSVKPARAARAPVRLPA
jgi:phytoene dehydrogenase-like protein